MHGGLPDKRNSELPAGEKRTLRAATDGSPSRPDSKCVRGDRADGPRALGEAEEDKNANMPVYHRFAGTHLNKPCVHPIFSFTESDFDRGRIQKSNFGCASVVPQRLKNLKLLHCEMGLLRLWQTCKHKQGIIRGQGAQERRMRQRR